MLDYVADIFHKHILASWVVFEAGTLGMGLTLSSLTVVLTVTDVANGQIQWTVEREKKCDSKETCMVFVHTFTFPSQFHIQLFKVNKLQVVFADLYGFTIYM